MIGTTRLAERPHFASESPEALLVTTVYEDSTTAQCAQKMVGRVLDILSHQMPIRECAWHSQTFHQPEIMDAAARQAGASDVLVVATYRDSPVLEKVIEWLDHWLAPRRERNGALVAVSVHGEGQPGPCARTEERFAEGAERIGMDFFATCVSAPTSG
jgi:hypothetical protein